VIVFPLAVTGTRDEVLKAAVDLRDAIKVDEVTDGVQPYVVGQQALWAGMQKLQQEDLAKAESTGFPAILIVLLAVFGSVLAALPRRAHERNTRHEDHPLDRPARHGIRDRPGGRCVVRQPERAGQRAPRRRRHDLLPHARERRDPVGGARRERVRLPHRAGGLRALERRRVEVTPRDAAARRS